MTTAPAKLTPRVEQEDSIVRILAEPTKAALIGDETGYGKTLLATEVIVRAGWKRVLLLGISATFPQWADRLAAQSDGAIQLRRLDSTKAGREAFDAFLAGEPGHYFTTIQWATAQNNLHRDKTDYAGNKIPKIDRKTGLPTDKFERERVNLKVYEKMSNRKAGPVDAIIFDESHAIANRDSIGRKTLLSIKTDWKIAMSATWSGNRFDFAWSTTRWLWPELIPAYWTWREEWCRTETKYVNGGRAVQEVVGEKEPEGGFVKTLPLYLRREHDMKAPPAVIVECDSTVEQRAQYEDLKSELMTWASSWSGDREPLVVDIPAVLRSRLRQVALAELSLDQEGKVTFAPNAASAKLRALRGVLDRWAGQPVVIMTDSKIYAKLVAARMTAAGYRAEAWTGDSSQGERQRLKADFIEGRLPYLVMTVQSGGTGVDGLQFACSKIVWLSIPEGDPKLVEQALGRVFRPGMTTEYGAFEHVRINMRDSLDTEILENLLLKGKAIRDSIGAQALNAA
ncbi:helicase-related protein [Microbacterium sp. zg-YB36]|uniref:helicase-related protein n=1 Tax=Microbacterium sp. zg-YB36 TaxID=2969407 RepID=UPI00214CCAE5|nr:helicase-related protein [Microbacterium sp. zg-YB36]MDL5351140.1 SNF2-related protein [Microbacterium sp. zg-YB36]